MSWLASAAAVDTSAASADASAVARAAGASAVRCGAVLDAVVRNNGKQNSFGVAYLQKARPILSPTLLLLPLSSQTVREDIHK